MSSSHVRAAQGGGYYEVVFHIPVPAESNAAGISLQTALVNSGTGGTTRLTVGKVGEITNQELTDIQAGRVYEVSETLLLDSAGGLAGIQGYLDAELARLSADVVNDLRGRLHWFGLTRG